MCALITIVLLFLMWSLCELLISPPCTLDDEAPQKTEALIDGLEHNDKLHNQNQRTLYFLLESMAALSHLPLTSFQPMRKTWTRRFLWAQCGHGHVAWALLYPIPKEVPTLFQPLNFPCHLVKPTLALHRVTDDS